MAYHKRVSIQSNATLAFSTIRQALSRSVYTGAVAK